MSSTNTLNLHKCRHLSIGKKIKHPQWSRNSFSSLFTLSQMTNFRQFQIQRVCRQQFQSQWKLQKVYQMDRKHCGKRRNCSLRTISPFPAVFSKGLYCTHTKTWAVWERVNKLANHKTAGILSFQRNTPYTE